MLLDIITKGSTDRSVCIRIIDSTDGTPETAVAYNTSGIDLWYRREGAAVVSITEATLAALTTAHTDGGFLAVSHGYYRLDLPDAAFATGANYVDIGGTVTGMVVIGGRVRLVDYNPEDSVRMGMTALPNAAAAASGGLFIRGTGAGAINQDANGRIDVNAIAVSGDTTAADNLETAFDETAGPVPWLGIVDQGTAQSASSTGVVLRSAAAFADDTLVGCTIAVLGSTQGYWQFREITDSALSGDTVTVDAWGVTPSGTITYKIFGGPPAPATPPSVNVTQISGDSTAADNAEAFFDGTGYAGTNNVIPTVTTLTGHTAQTGDAYARLGAPAGASVSADVAAIKTDTGNLVTRITSSLFSGITSMAQWLGLLAGKQTGNSTARTEIRATGAGSGTFDETTDSIEALRDRGDAAWATATGFSTLDAAGVRAAVGLASANLDTQLSAIVADTNELQTDWANGGRLDLILDARASQSSLDSTDGKVDSIKAVTDKLDDTMEDDGGTYRFTTNALEQAPSGTGASAASIAAAMFTVDTGETEGDAVPGSVVYEIVQNAGGGGGLDAAGVRAALGMAAADLDDQLDAIKSDTAATLADTEEIGAAGAGLTALASAANLATLAGYVDTEVAAIKAKTDNLPSDPADASEITGAFSTVNGTLATIAGYIDTEVAAIKAKTDLIPASPAAVGDIPTASANADALLAKVIEGTVTLLQSIRLMNSALAGKASGLDTTNPIYRDLGDTKNRIDATVDADGNRSAVTLDLS
jgi:cell division protein ZapA (FtsZ GTPase activity inhibitor)